MFRVVFYVDDRKLGEALLRLQGFAQGAPEVQPVTNAKVGRNGKLVATSSGTAVDQFINLIREHKLTTVAAKDAGEFLKSVGRDPSNSTGLLSRVEARGVITRVSGKRGKGYRATYKVKS